VALGIARITGAGLPLRSMVKARRMSSRRALGLVEIAEHFDTVFHADATSYWLLPERAGPARHR